MFCMIRFTLRIAEHEILIQLFEIVRPKSNADAQAQPNTIMQLSHCKVKAPWLRMVHITPIVIALMVILARFKK